MKLNKKLKILLNIFIFLSTISLFIFIESNDVNHLITKNRFTEIDSRVPGGIKFSLDEGLTSYGMFEIGFDVDDEKYSSFSIDSNLYDRVEEINVHFLERGEVNADINIISYQKVNGVFVRIFPFLIYKITSIFSSKFLFLQLVYTLSSIIGFLYLFIKIQETHSLIFSFLFYMLFITNPFFITYASSFIAPFFVSLIPLLVVSSKKIRRRLLNSKSSILIATILALPSLISNTLGPLVFLSFLTGIKLFEKNFDLLKNKVFILKSLFISFVLLIFGEMLWIFQRIFLLSENVNDVFSDFFKSVGKYNVLSSNQNSFEIESCANLSSLDFVTSFFNVKMNDFIFFEVYLKHYIYLLIAIFIFNIFRNNEILNLDFQFITLNLTIYFLWFYLIKGAFGCHLHVYPRYFLLALIPSLFIKSKEVNIID
tara:strand:+ start:83 stop:1360 length:1278 start_codon:yes stop_codon:yes gene_type:complete